MLDHVFVDIIKKDMFMHGGEGVGDREFTDKTVHRHVFWRQFTDKIGDSSPTYLKTVHRQTYYFICFDVDSK